jgi:hypothetical protein
MFVCGMKWSWNRVLTCSSVFVLTRKAIWNPNCNTAESDLPQRDRPSASVITQQYSSATFIRLHFHSHKHKFGAIFNNFTFWGLKLHTKKMRKSDRVCIVVRLGICLEKLSQLTEASAHLAAVVRRGNSPGIPWKQAFPRLRRCVCLLGCGM